jgi:hypothetical protein
MTLSAGARLGPYIPETAIDAGGKSRARNTHLDSAISITALNERTANDSDQRLASKVKPARSLDSTISHLQKQYV